MDFEKFREQYLNVHKDRVYLKSVQKLGSSAKNVYVIDNFLSNEEHKTISNFVNSDQTSWIAEPWGTERTMKDSVPEDIIELLKKIFEISRENCIDYYDIKLNTDFNGEYILTKWSKGDAMQPHVDTDAQKHQHIVCMYYINDDYDGGELVFPDYDLKIKPKLNSLIMFPGNENYLHGVLEVSKGHRYTFGTRFVFSGSTFVGPTGIREWAQKENLKLDQGGYDE